MKKILFLIISMISTLLICGFSLTAICLTAVSILVLSWITFFAENSYMTLFAVNNPDMHTPEVLATAISKCLLNAADSSTKTRLIVSNPGLNTLKITSSGQEEIKITDTHRTITVENSRLWIAEHPLPLYLKSGDSLQLYFRPSIIGRIHVSTGLEPVKRQIIFLLFPAAMLLMVYNLNYGAAILLAPLLNILLNRRFM